MEICTEVNVTPLNTKFSCYNIIDKATSIVPKNIETSIISFVPLYQIEAKFTKLSQSARKKSLDKSIS